MPDKSEVDVDELIDSCRVSGFMLRIAIVCWAILFIDGFDLGALFVTAPAIVEDWQIGSAAALGYVFSAVLAGTMLGTLIFGWIGDRYGRRTALVIGCVWIGLTSLATVFTTNIPELFVARVLTGIAVGGLGPNVLAMTAEFSPNRVRARVMIFTFTGITLGGGAGGILAPILIPRFGWESMFVFGGVIPLVLALVVLRYLPESLKFLVVRGKDQKRMASILHRLAPSTDIPVASVTLVTREKLQRNASPKLLLEGDRRYFTLLMWLMYFLSGVTVFFVKSWLPTALQGAGFDEYTPLLLTAFSAGGLAGGLLIARFVDKHGMIPIIVLYLIAIPTTCAIGYASSVKLLVPFVVFFSGFSLLGIQFILNAAGALLYPTSLRASGSAYAGTAGRLGSVAGPTLAGWLLASGLSIEHFYLTLALPLGLGTVSALLFIWEYRRRFRRHDFASEAAI
jgi:MFS transporter, AAHS family, 4-hydroxybenzoate transporter